jgi:hypothetical protein
MDHSEAMARNVRHHFQASWHGNRDKSLQSNHSSCLILFIGNSWHYRSMLALLSHGLQKKNPQCTPSHPIRTCNLLLGRIVAERRLHLLFMPGDVHAETKLLPQNLLQGAAIPKVDPFAHS